MSPPESEEQRVAREFASNARHEANLGRDYANEQRFRYHEETMTEIKNSVAKTIDKVDELADKGSREHTEMKSYIVRELQVVTAALSEIRGTLSFWGGVRWLLAIMFAGAVGTGGFEILKNILMKP